MKEYFTLDDFKNNLEDKYVAVRIDLNSDIVDGKLIPNERFERHSKTIKELAENKAKIILLAHQSRKGEPDFISLEQHAKILSEYVGIEIKFVNDIIGERAENEIKKLKPGEVLLLDNVRFLEDEDVEKSFEEHAKSSLVEFLSKFIDYYVLDAFSVAHRAHASVVGFAYGGGKGIPLIAGRVLEDEIRNLENFLSSKEIVFLVGGAKVDDVISVLKYIFEKSSERVKYVICGGVVANLFLKVSRYEIGSGSEEILRKIVKNNEEKLKELESAAKWIYEKYKEKIILPKDFLVKINGDKIECKIGEVPKNATILDIGFETIKYYKDIIGELSNVNIFIKGPMGKFEEKGFENGTKEMLSYIAELTKAGKIKSLVGGGDTSVAMEKLGIDKNDFTYVSTGGGALITYLSGKPMLGLEALKINYRYLTTKKEKERG
ncbi:MAG: phosphoglycerate kinase [Candidatus Aenigmatarchaeota archaeon]